MACCAGVPLLPTLKPQSPVFTSSTDTPEFRNPTTAKEETNRLRKARREGAGRTLRRSNAGLGFRSLGLRGLGL